MPDGSRPTATWAGWRCHVAWVLLLLSVLSWHESGTSPFMLSLAQEQVGTLLATIAAFLLAVQANPMLLLARVPSQLLAVLLVVASAVPAILGLAPVNSLLLSARFALIVFTIWLLGPIIMANPVAALRTHLWAHGVLVLCVLAGGILAPGRAFLPGTHRLAGLLPPMHPSQVGAIATVTLGLSLLALIAGAIDRRLGTVAILVATLVLIQSRSRTSALAALAGLVVALVSMALVSPRARRLLGVLAGVGAAVWITVAPAIVSWFARGQTHAQLSGFSGRRAVWIAMVEERPTGLTDWVGIGLGDKTYKGDPIDGGWIAAYWQQGMVGVGITALLLLAIAWHALRNPDGLLRAVSLFLTVFVAVSANTETGVSDTSVYFLSVLLAGLFATVRPSIIQGNRHADRRRPQPLPLSLSQRREPGG